MTKHRPRSYQTAIQKAALCEDSHLAHRIFFHVSAEMQNEEKWAVNARELLWAACGLKDEVVNHPRWGRMGWVVDGPGYALDCLPIVHIGRR